jgi:cytochrome b561
MSKHYTRTAVSLHWLIAGLIIAAVFLGWTMTDMDISPARLKRYNYHKWVGITVLALAVVRLVWKMTHKAPALLPMPRWQQIAAHATHGLLYVLMLAVPISGWVYSNASGYPVVYLGKLPLPNLVEKDRELAASWVEVHEALAIGLVTLVALHLLAVLKHQFISKDKLLSRMLSWRK